MVAVRTVMLLLLMLLLAVILLVVLPLLLVVWPLRMMLSPSLLLLAGSRCPGCARYIRSGCAAPFTTTSPLSSRRKPRLRAAWSARIRSCVDCVTWIAPAPQISECIHIGMG